MPAFEFRKAQRTFLNGYRQSTTRVVGCIMPGRVCRLIFLANDHDPHALFQLARIDRPGVVAAQDGVSVDPLFDLLREPLGLVVGQADRKESLCHHCEPGTVAFGRLHGGRRRR